MFPNSKLSTGTTMVALVLPERFRMSACSSLLEALQMTDAAQKLTDPVEFRFRAADPQRTHCSSFCGLKIAVEAEKDQSDLVVHLESPPAFRIAPDVFSPDAQRALLRLQDKACSSATRTMIGRFHDYVLHRAHREADFAIQQIFDLLEENAASNRPISQLVSQSTKSLRQIERRFLNTIGITMRDCRFLMRLARARFLVEWTNRSLTEIAHDCGFCDSAHFSRAFATRYAMPPTRARKIARRYGEPGITMKYNRLAEVT